MKKFNRKKENGKVKLSKNNNNNNNNNNNKNLEKKIDLILEQLKNK
jgi:hypothetical protein